MNSKLVSRARYEKERVKYPDMPAPDAKIEDWGAEILKEVKRERRQRRKAAKNHQADPTAANRVDQFCIDLMKDYPRKDAVIWIKSPKNTLGEHSHRKSTHLVAKLLKLGCQKIWACKIDRYDDGMENTGHLIVELPPSPKARQPLLEYIDQLASEQGYSGDFDDGQRFAYIKLD